MGRRPRTKDIVRSVSGHIAEVEIELATILQQMDTPLFPPINGKERDADDNS